MKKEGLVGIIILASTIFLIMPLISASAFSDFFNKIFFSPGPQPTNVTISVTGANQAQIVYVQTATPISPIENGSVNVNVNVTMYDPDGVNDLDHNSVKVFLNTSVIGEATRSNLSCIHIIGQDAPISSPNRANYSCTATMWYWDAGGGWTVNATGRDVGNGAVVSNASTYFTYSQLKAMAITPLGLLWSSLATGAYNQTSTNDPTIINNTGNYNLLIGITSYDLVGQTTRSEYIPAGNFSSSPTTGFILGGAENDPKECNSAGINMATSLVNATNTPIIGATANKGNLSLNNGTGQRSVYYCLRQVPASGLSSQTYSTVNSAGQSIWPWILSYPV